MGGLPNQTSLYDAVTNGKTIGKDGKAVDRRQIRLPADKSGESMTTIEESDGARAQLHKDRLVLESRTLPLKRNLRFYYLRDMCKCPQCVDPHSKQRSFRTSDITPNIRPRYVYWDGEQLEVKWYNDIPGYGDDHTSQWNHEYLRKPVNDTHNTASKNMSPYRWTGRLMTTLQHWISYKDYMNDDIQFTAAMRNLSRLGIIFVKNVPASREMVEKIATRMGPLRNTFYGSTWDVKTVPEAKNVAYTNQFLGFHMDLMYMNEPPGYQLLHCLENSCEGGESLFADTFRAASIMKAHMPAEYNILTKRHLGYEYVHEDLIYHKTRPVFEIDHETGDLRYVNYSPPFQSALPEWADKGGAAESYRGFQRALNRFASILDQHQSAFRLKLNPGECVIFANRRVVHARNQFNTTEGSRWLAGAYVDEDALLSRFAVCCKKDFITWRAADPVKDAFRRKAELKAERDAQAAQKLREYSRAQEEGSSIGGEETKDGSHDVESEQVVGAEGKARD